MLAPDEGVMLVTVGGESGEVMVNPLESTPSFPFRFLTTTLYWPAVVPERGNVQVILVGETTVTPVALILAEPLRVRCTVAPFAKLVPARFVIETDPVLAPDDGVMLVMVGTEPPGEVMVNPLESNPSFPFRFLTTTLYWPAVVPERGSVQVILVGETTTTPVALILAEPLRVRCTVAPLAKLVPARFVIATDPVFAPDDGVMLVTVGFRIIRGFKMEDCDTTVRQCFITVIVYTSPCHWMIQIIPSVVNNNLIGSTITYTKHSMTYNLNKNRSIIINLLFILIIGKSSLNTFISINILVIILQNCITPDSLQQIISSHGHHPGLLEFLIQYNR